MLGTVLVVDDLQANVDIVSRLLGKEFTVHGTTNPQEVLALARQIMPDVILLDVSMPDTDGFTVCTALKQDPQVQDIPVIFLSALGEVHDKVQGLKVGGVDYVTKPFSREELTARVSRHAELYRLQKQRAVEQQQERAVLERLLQEDARTLRSVSHDLKNPLTVITSSLQLMRLRFAQEIGNDQHMQKYLDMANRGLEQMHYLVTSVLDETRRGQRTGLLRENISLVPYLREMLADIQIAALNKRITVHFTPPDQEVVISVAPREFARAIQNLLSNAVKYTPQGGSVALGATVTPEVVAIQVRDTGYGIPREDLPRLFEPHFRVNRPEHQAQDGTGLGLAIVKDIVDRHGGTISVESALGEGSAFTITLPRQEWPRGDAEAVHTA